MITIPLPQPPRLTSHQGNISIFTIEGLSPGYGITIANALRRVILSSLPGAAVIGVKIKEVDHEFSTIPGVKEDVVNILLNLEKMRFRIHEHGLYEGHLHIKGEREVRAGDIKLPGELEIVNPELIIATLTDKKADLEMTIWVTEGIGYEMREEHRPKPSLQGVGILTLDSIFTPIVSANFNVDNMRLGERTDYNRITFTIETDGTISPEEALKRAIETLIEQFNAMKEVAGSAQGPEATKKKVKTLVKGVASLPEELPKEDSLSSRNFITHLKLSSRIEKILRRHRVKTIKQLMQKNEEELMKMDGIGEAAVKEIRRKLGKAGFLLGIKQSS